MVQLTDGCRLCVSVPVSFAVLFVLQLLQQGLICRRCALHTFSPCMRALCHTDCAL